MKTVKSKTDDRIVNSEWTTSLGITMIVLGIFAIIFPFSALFTAPLFFGLLFILAGIAQIIYAVQSRGIGRGFWKLILGLLDLIAGVVVVIYPLGGVSIAFPLIAGTTIAIQGVIQVSISLQMRRMLSNWGWLLISGITSIILGIFIYSSSILSAAWLIGSAIGIDLLLDGVWMLTLHLGQRST
jgi:uncharacterized membrane protein HdeD (DUF308 family)